MHPTMGCQGSTEDLTSNIQDMHKCMGSIYTGTLDYTQTKGLEFVNHGHLLPENDALQVERVLNDPCGGDANPKYILLGRQIGRVGDTIHIT